MDERVIEMSHDLFSTKFGEDGKANTLAATDYKEPPVVCYSIGSMNSEGMLSENPTSGIHETKVARTIDANGSNPAGYQGGDLIIMKKCYAIDHVVTTGGNCTAQGPCWYENICPTEKAGGVHAVCYGISRSMLKGGMNAGGMPVEKEIQPTITANGCGAVVYDARGNGDGCVCQTITGDHENRITDYTALAVSIGNGQLNQMSMEPVANALDCMHDQQAVLTNGKPPRKYIVRRLTPIECGRLQGFPDWWVDGADGSDSAVYKMWGNGIALPCAAEVMGRIAKAVGKRLGGE